MKTLAVFIVGFVCGLFAPEIQHLQHIPFPKHFSVDPVVIVLALIAFWGISKARAKHKGGKS